MVLEKLDSSVQKNEIRTLPDAIQFSHSVVSVLCDPIDCSMPCFPVLTPYKKINSKWIKDLNVRPETIKLFEENIDRTLNDINQSKIFYDPPHRIMEIKTKIKKWNLIKLRK